MEAIDAVVFGAGGFGREVAAMLKNPVLAKRFRLAGYLDDGVEAGKIVNNFPVLGGVSWLEKREKPTAIFLALGSPKVRRIVREKIKNPMVVFPNLVHPDSQWIEPEFIKMGEGNIIGAGNILTTNIQIGNFNLINLSCTIGHDVVVHNFCSIMPGVNISGGAILKDEVFLGTGVKLIKATTLGRGCTVGAGSVVNKDIPAEKTFVGIPSKELNR